MTDKELLEKIQQGDNQAFRELIKKNKTLVFKTVLGFVHDRDTAEDLTQEVFIKFWEKRHDFELKGKISTWLYRVAVNTAINFNRKKKFFSLFTDLESKAQKTQDDDDLSLQFEDKLNYDAHKQIENQELGAIIKKAVNQLPKRQRIVFVLNEYRNLDYKEIAEIMDTSYATVVSLMNRAKQNLQKKLLKFRQNGL